MLCPTHQVELVQKPGGVSKTTGKPYNPFMACPGKNVDGSYCRFKPSNNPQPQTPVQQFGGDLDRMSAQETAARKEEAIARAVALKAAVDFYQGKQTMPEGVVTTAGIFLNFLTA